LARFSREILPGGEGEIVLSVDTGKQRVPHYHRQATVTSNDRNSPQTKLTIEGDIEFVVTTTPPQLRLSGLAGTSLSGEVTLAPGTDLAIDVKGGKALKNQCRIAAIEPLEGGRYVARIEVDAADLPGMLRDIVEFEVLTEDGKSHKSQVNVSIDHLDKVTIQPRGNIVFQRAHTMPLKQPNANPVRRDLQIFSSAPDIQFQVTGVEILDVPEGVFSTEIRPIKEGQRYVVSVFVREYRSEPSIRGRMKIYTDDPEVGEREIRLYAQFGDVPQRATPRGAQKPNSRGVTPAAGGRRPASPQKKPGLGTSPKGSKPGSQ